MEQPLWSILSRLVIYSALWALGSVLGLLLVGGMVASAFASDCGFPSQTLIFRGVAEPVVHQRGYQKNVNLELGLSSGKPTLWLRSANHCEAICRAPMPRHDGILDFNCASPILSSFRTKATLWFANNRWDSVRRIRLGAWLDGYSQYRIKPMRLMAAR